MTVNPADENQHKILYINQLNKHLTKKLLSQLSTVTFVLI